MTKKLLIRDFFEHFDKGCPYHCASMMELQEAIDKAEKDMQDYDDWVSMKEQEAINNVD